MLSAWLAVSSSTSTVQKPSSPGRVRSRRACTPGPEQAARRRPCRRVGSRGRGGRGSERSSRAKATPTRARPAAPSCCSNVATSVKTSACQPSGRAAATFSASRRRRTAASRRPRGCAATAWYAAASGLTAPSCHERKTCAKRARTPKSSWSRHAVDHRAVVAEEHRRPRQPVDQREHRCRRDRTRATTRHGACRRRCCRRVPRAGATAARPGRARPARPARSRPDSKIAAWISAPLRPLSVSNARSLVSGSKRQTTPPRSRTTYRSRFLHDTRSRVMSATLSRADQRHRAADVAVEDRQRVVDAALAACREPVEVNPAGHARAVRRGRRPSRCRCRAARRRRR